ncbi:SOS response-associated peptidase family protein [Sphingomonas edaphi]|uniref:Abasic site processing protein n=1 Tax=Sphingomonas edaphi TaxID=2315689 RepID=A0A418Q3S3_9SPHN|nr:SOS response-associated peptidase [Sphingomonas edaphi]RIX32554.1 SOS response-associated peptidase [Sphingomonas edaphi]
MCNLYRLHKGSDAIRQIFAGMGTKLSFPEGIPNLEPRDVHITDPGAIVRAGVSGPELVIRRWSWPQATGKPLYNLRSEGRNFARNRGLVIADGFYEYTAPEDPKKKRKDRWLFKPADGGLLGIAGILCAHPQVGEAFTLLTAEPGPDVAPFHRRQIVLLPPRDWSRWLDPAVPSSELLKPSDAGYLTVEPA